MPQRDINEIRTNKIAVRCDTVEELKGLCALYGCRTEKTNEIIEGFINGECFSDMGYVGTASESSHIESKYTIHPASDYLPTETTTPAKYSAEEIKLMDGFATAAMQGEISTRLNEGIPLHHLQPVAEYSYKMAIAMLTERNRILTA